PNSGRFGTVPTFDKGAKRHGDGKNNKKDGHQSGGKEKLLEEIGHYRDKSLFSECKNKALLNLMEIILPLSVQYSDCFKYILVPDRNPGILGILFFSFPRQNFQA